MEIGFQLYADMLKAAVSALKSGREPDLTAPLGVATEINLHVPALLPDDYCSDVHERLVLYKRLANCDSADELEAMHEELVDRFGSPPEAAQALARLPSAAPRRPAARRRQDRRRPRAHDAAVRAQAAVRPGQADPAWSSATAGSASPAPTACASSAARPR